MTVKDYLMQYLQLEKAIDDKIERVKELKVESTSISANIGDNTALIVKSCSDCRKTQIREKTDLSFLIC